MYHTIGVFYRGYCADLDFVEELDSATIQLEENLDDAFPFLFSEKFGEPYNSLAWFLVPGAKEWKEDLEDKWLHNQLDLYDLYKRQDFIEYLSEKFQDYSSELVDMEDLQEEFEDRMKDELGCLSNYELKELYEYDDEVRYEILDDYDNVVASGYVELPELEEDDEEEDD